MKFDRFIDENVRGVQRRIYSDLQWSSFFKYAQYISDAIIDIDYNKFTSDETFYHFHRCQCGQ